MDLDWDDPEEDPESCPLPQAPPPCLISPLLPIQRSLATGQPLVEAWFFQAASQTWVKWMWHAELECPVLVNKDLPL